MIYKLFTALMQSFRPEADMYEGTNLTERSKKNLIGVHADLVAVILSAIRKANKADPPLKVQITEGVRTVVRQQQLYASGATHTMNFKHLTGRAVDVIGDWQQFCL